MTNAHVQINARLCQSMLKDKMLQQTQFEKGRSLHLDFCMFPLSPSFCTVSDRRTNKQTFSLPLKLSLLFMSLDKKGGVRSDVSALYLSFARFMELTYQPLATKIRGLLNGCYSDSDWQKWSISTLHLLTRGLLILIWKKKVSIQFPVDSLKKK